MHLSYCATLRRVYNNIEIFVYHIYYISSFFLKASIYQHRGADVIQRVRVQIRGDRTRYNRYYTKLQQYSHPRIFFFFYFLFFKYFLIFFVSFGTSTGLYITIADGGEGGGGEDLGN